MIPRDEVDGVASALELTPSNVQRDYVFGWLLAGVFGESKLGESVALKGGNALRKGYFADTRFSDDLDFTTERSLDEDLLLEEFNAICRFVEARTGVDFDLDRNRIVDSQIIDRTKRVYKMRLYFRDFASGADHITLKVRVDLTEYDRIYLPLQQRQLIHPYSDADECSGSIACVKLEEVLADKLKCLIQRRYCYDLFDLVYCVFINNELDIDRAELVSVFLKKTIFGASPLAAKRLLLGIPLDLLRGFWQKVVAPASSRFSFDHASALLQDGVEALFAPFGYGARMAVAFFPPEHRNVILQAGAERKLLLLTYHGATRLVEPYSLAYKRRKDGVAQEYFLAWDQTGGNSGPGVKTFVHYDIQRLELTNQSFEPRFEIELSKAGDRSMASVFVGNRGSRVARPSRARARRPANYRVECSYCGKRFSRSQPGTRLNNHKDRYGNRCYGRVGYYV